VAFAVHAIPTPQDPAGDKNIGNGQGAQFITGACISNADCASGCCAGLNGGGVCSAELVAFAQGKQGCGFVGAGGAGTGAGSNAGTGTGANAGSNTDNGAVTGDTGNGAANGAVASQIDTSLAGSQNVGKGDGSQFITGQCFSDADCASTCCNKNTGLCNAIGAIGIENCGFLASA
jgi:hypothetical protein